MESRLQNARKGLAYWTCDMATALELSSFGRWAGSLDDQIHEIMMLDSEALVGI